MATTAGATAPTNAPATALTSPPKRQSNTPAGKPVTPPSGPPFKVPKHISRLVMPFWNDAIEIYIVPDSVLEIRTEKTSLRRDASCWIIFSLPPIQTDPQPEPGLAFQLKPPFAP